MKPTGSPGAASPIVCAALAVGLALSVAPSEARADNMNGLGTFLFGMVLGGPVAVTATVSIVGNSVYLANGQRSGLGWRTTGWLSGLVSVGAGTLVLISDGQNDSFAFGLGISEIAIGAVSVGLAIGAGLMPEARPVARNRPRWNVSPLALRDARGDATPGLQLSLTTF